MSQDIDLIQSAIDLLKNLAQDPDQWARIPEAQKLALMTAAGQLSRASKDEIRKREKAQKKFREQLIRNEDRKARAVTGIRSARTHEVFTAPLQLTAGADPEMKLNSP